MGYTPLDDGLPTSTVSVCGGPIVLALWSVFMAWKDQDGLVKLTPRAVEALWSKSLMPLPLEVIQQAWDYLASPDPQSANPMCAGRRIVPTDDGRWRVVSHDKYRDRHSGAVLRSQAAERQQRRRDRLKQAKGLQALDAVSQQLFEGNLPGSGGAAVETAPGLGSADPGVATGTPHSPAAARPLPRVHVTREATGERVPLEQSFQPTPQYATRERWDAAVLQAGELCSWLEGRVGRSSGQVFRHAADYPGASGFKARAESCSHARLEQTLITLLEWRRRIEARPDLLGRGGEHAWALKPQPGERVGQFKPDVYDVAVANINARMEAARDDGRAGTGADPAPGAGQHALPGVEPEGR